MMTLPFEHYDRVVCIPTYEEFQYVPSVLQQLTELPYKTLVILNNNCRLDSPQTAIDDNTLLHQWLLSHNHSTEGNLFLIEFGTIHILLIDHTTLEYRYASNHGVGLARHQCATLAIDLIEQGQIRCPWMWCTDGDVTLPENYLDIPPIKEGTQILGYWHNPAPPELMLYEMGLRYYSLGLQFAGSPIAFPTIGSCIVIHAKTYKQIYGFPDRQAAEDFYLLNKAMKVAPVYYSSEVTLTIRGRPSERVPFGTGRGMQEILDNNLEYHLYHPQIFNILKSWIQILNTASDEQLISALTEIVPDYPYFNKIKKVIQQPCPAKQRILRRHTFFDHFQTMRFIHHLREQHYPSLPWRRALDIAPFIQFTYDGISGNRDAITDLERQLRGRQYPLY